MPSLLTRSRNSAGAFHNGSMSSSLLQRIRHSLSGRLPTISGPLHPYALSRFRTKCICCHCSIAQLSVDVIIPSWLINTKLTCHAATAASRTFGKFISQERPPFAAYTAAGYELCRISYDAFNCIRQGSVVTLGSHGHIAVASMVKPRYPLGLRIQRPFP